jgi:hypothetical protein
VVDFPIFVVGCCQSVFGGSYKYIRYEYLYIYLWLLAVLPFLNGGEFSRTPIWLQLTTTRRQTTDHGADFRRRRSPRI